MTTTVSVCTGRSCRERFSPFVLARLRADVARLFPDADVAIGECLCRGRCEEGPNLELDGVLHTRMNPVKASELLVARVQAAKRAVSGSDRRQNRSPNQPHDRNERNDRRDSRPRAR